MKYESKENPENIPSEIGVGPFNFEYEPLLVTIRDVRRMLSCGKTKVYDMINSGELELRKLGRATRVTAASVHKAGQVK